MMDFQKNKFPQTFSLMLLGLLVSCAEQPLNRSGDFGALRVNGEQVQATREAPLEVSETRVAEHSRFRRPPSLDIDASPSFAGGRLIEDQLTGAAIELDINNMPLPAFIREVFGEQLNLSYLLHPGLEGQSDLVTLSLTEPLPPADLYRTARTVLAEYGVSIVQEADLLKFQVNQEVGTDVPLIVSGQALPDVPASHRPVFSMIPLRVVRTNSVTNWLEDLFKGTSLEVLDDPIRNAVILRGPVDIVKQGREAVKYLDQPLMRGRHSMVITPQYSDVESLSKDLEKVLVSEGYGVSSSPNFGAVILYPLSSQRSIVVFTSDEATLTHIQTWVEELDTRKQAEVTEGIFSYQAQYVTAEHIVSLLSALSGDETALPVQQPSSNLDQEGGFETGNTSSASLSGVNYGSGRLVVDHSRNVLFFKGAGLEWLQIQDTIENLDQPVPSVLVEVLLAEVTLNEQESFGVEWLFNGQGVDGQDLIGSTIGGLDLGSSGLSLNSFNSAGQTRALINAFNSNNRAVIRSSPKILVKSGGMATIEVGNEIPVITSNSQSTTDANSPVIQNIQYRKTGVILTIEPIVQASGLVDIAISQELSEEQVTQSSSTGSPIILNRRLETQLSLRDGDSVLLGGLISTSQSNGTSSVPLLGDIPWMGRLFRSDTQTESRTELLMLLIPYVITENRDAIELTESLKMHLELLEK